MWVYEQDSGRLRNPDGEIVGVGYSGRYPDGKNIPSQQSVKDVGPIPVGKYRIGSPFDTMTHGPFVLPLAPHQGNEMFDRSGFLIHGDSVVNPGSASEGCIIQARNVREMIAASGDPELLVVSTLMPVDLDGEISV